MNFRTIVAALLCLHASLLASCLLAQTGTATPTPDAPPAVADVATEPALMDLWVGFYIGTAKVRCAQAEAQLVQDEEGRELIRLRERHWMRQGSQLQGHVFESATRYEMLMRPEDLAITSMSEITKEREREKRVTVTLSADGKSMERVSKMVGQTYRRTFAIPGPVIGSNDLLMKRLFDEGKLVPGFEHTFYELDLGVPEAREKTLHVTAVDATSGKVSVAFDDVTLTLGPDGFLEEGYYGDLKVVSEPPELARNFGKLFAANDELDLDYLVPRLPGIDGVVVDITVTGDPRGDVFQDATYQEVLDIRKEADAVTYRVLMKSYGPRPASRQPFPVAHSPEEVAALGAFLEPTPLIQADAPEIRQFAARWLQRTRDQLSAVKTLQQAVSRSLSQTYTKIAALSAIETLQQRRGDCAEHAVLFDALARSQGIPTRQCSGYVFWGSSGGRHAWNQALIGGTWVHVDCIGRLLASGPQYIQFSSESADGSSDREVSRRLHVLSTCETTMSVVGFRRSGKRYPLSTAEKQGDFMAEGYDLHPFTRLQVTPPEGWEWRGHGGKMKAEVLLARGDLVVQVGLDRRSSRDVALGITWRYRSAEERAGREVVEGGEALLPAEAITDEHLHETRESRVLGTPVARRELLAVGRTGGGSLVITLAGDVRDLDDAARSELKTLLASIRSGD